ncbi:ribonuclease R [Comamonas flocculans]|uniref:Ribonuclease R n=1 Tax=Comamonas flocculans TaxID=2597701 RepID=A0A5B8S180_9BURK|nr:ribonuclease R [Comamonas flocculans]QEA14297.1 ribonuclease R [Comamonas flocculans]
MYSKKNEFHANANKEIEGSVRGHRDGHGFVLRDDGEGDIYLAPNEMRAVLHKDRVRVRIIGQDRRGRPEGRVLEIIERPSQTIIGRLLHEAGIWLVAPEDTRYGQDVLVPRSAIGSASVGQVVVVQLTEPPALHGQPVGRVVEVLGEIDDPGMEVEIAVRKYGVPHVFSDACLAQAQALPDQVREADWQGRVDLSDVPFVTIDGEDARDFDDAVYCAPMRLGRAKAWRLLVAIADVSHYVDSGGAIDADAYERATSVYFPRRVLPMLPEKLSNGLCSLNPGVARLAMVCDMVINGKGQTHAYQFYPAVIQSHARLTYAQVSAALANTRGSQAAQLSAQLPDLLHLHEAYRALLAARHARGAVDFETTETQIVCDDNGRIEKIEPRVRTEAHRLIEECMLAANVCAADFVGEYHRDCLYRVHDKPTPEKLELLRAYLKALAVHVNLPDDPPTAAFQAIAAATRDRPDAAQIHGMLLRSMQQAIYTPINSGHFGLAFDAYTHFTSPIRRYPDLLVHRVIKSILEDKTYQLPALPLPGEAQHKLARQWAAKGRGEGQGGAAPASKSRLAWEAAGLHCSANERRADEASRDVEAWLKCQYMREHLGEEYGGVVTAVAGFGIFVTLDALYVEGMVHITELGGEYFRFDEVRQELRGERTGMRYAVGTRLRVQVSRVDLDGRKIDFRLVHDESASIPARPETARAARKASRRSDEDGADGAPAVPQAKAAAPRGGRGSRHASSGRGRRSS